MNFGIGSPLPPYRVRAAPSEIEPPNLIYQDEQARHYGYRGGLVPTASIYAYMSHSLVELLGRDWLDRGSAEVRFEHPLFDGEELRVSGQVSSVEEDGSLGIDYRAENGSGVACGLGAAWLPAHETRPEPSMEQYPRGKLEERQRVSLQSLDVGHILCPFQAEFTWKQQWEYCQKNIRDHLPQYQSAIHPGWLLTLANWILVANYDLPAWVPISSRVQHFHLQETECLVDVRGLVSEKYEYKGHHVMVLDLAVFADSRCLQIIRNTVIFRVAPKAA